MLAGMFRVRQLTQDDSHVFCRDDQVDDELRLALSLVRKQYAPFGFEPRAKLATRPEKTSAPTSTGSGPSTPAGSARGGRHGVRARSRRRRVLRAEDRHLHRGRARPRVADGDDPGRLPAAAALRPRVPRRYGGFERPVVIHYAIYGSFERFIGIITEHYTGAFPFWLAPVQVMVVPIADRHLDYAGSVRQALPRPACGRGRRPIERMQLKLREAQEQKIPVMVVVGDRDAEAEAVSPRLRTGESSQGVPLDEFVADLVARDAAREPVAAGAEAPSEAVSS